MTVIASTAWPCSHRSPDRRGPPAHPPDSEHLLESFVPQQFCGVIKETIVELVDLFLGWGERIRVEHALVKFRGFRHCRPRAQANRSYRTSSSRSMTNYLSWIVTSEFDL